MSDEQAEVKTEEVEVSTELKNIIEALIFANDEPMTVRFIRSIMDDVNKDIPPAEHFIVNAEIIRKAVGDLNRGYGRIGSGFRIIEVAGGFVYATQEQFSSWVGKLAKEKARRRLSPTAVETLAIIAYKQPIAKGEVEFIRGVNVDYIINALLEKDLIHITGRATTPGRPLLYGTTQKFLEHFGLNELSDLPKPREIEELIGETELEVDRRLLAEQQELEFKEDLEKKMDGNEGSKNKPQRGSKIKLENEVKAEERRKKGESLSESNQKIIEKAAEIENIPTVDTPMIENAQAHPEANVRDHLETNEQDHLERSVQDHSEIKDHENQMNDQGRLRENETKTLSESSEAVLNEVGAEDQTTNEQDLSINENLMESPGESSEPRPMVNNQVRPMAEEVADHSVQSIKSEHRDQAQDRQIESGSGQGSGWSKWKNKVKTFFQKLFA